MKRINKDELYENLSEFLKTKGIELKEGSFTQPIRKGCNLLAEMINLSQKGISKAKTGVDKKLDQMRQAIHERTAPKADPPSHEDDSDDPTATPPRKRTRKPPS